MSQIRVACVGYTNAWPLTRNLDRALFDVLPCVPSEAARLLRDGAVDVGLIPVAALLNDDAYRVVPGMAIGCDGDVASVLLVGETPLEEWDAVALDGESRTSVILAQILLNGPLKRPGMRVYGVDAGTGAFHAQGRTGAVVIGDAARNLPDRLVTRIDLGRVWKEWTGLPFVFAVWAMRPGMADAALIADAFRRLKDTGITRVPELIAVENFGDAEMRRRYLTEYLHFGIGPRGREALALYRSLLAKHRIIASSAEPLRFIG